MAGPWSCVGRWNPAPSREPRRRPGLDHAQLRASRRLLAAAAALSVLATSAHAATQTAVCPTGDPQQLFELASHAPTRALLLVQKTIPMGDFGKVAIAGPLIPPPPGQQVRFRMFVRPSQTEGDHQMRA